MGIVVRCWEEMTGEVLRPNGPTALFGDRRHGRQEEDAQQYAHLEEPWRALHAAVVIALDVARRNSRPPEYTKRKLHQAPLDEEQQPLPWSTARIMSRACKELNKIARRRADQLLQKRATCNRSAYPEFQKAWIDTGLAVVRKGQVCTRILANWRDPRPIDAQQRLLVLATDGSGRGGQAGWGLTAVRTTQECLTVATTTGFSPERAVREECGRVVVNQTQPEYLGAKRATNNTAELSAVHHALGSARELRQKGEAVLILSDSQLAICTTTGAWASRKHKALVERNRKALAQLRAGGADVIFRHVRAHTGHGMNERADELAAQGAQGLRRRGNAIYVPLDGQRLPADTVPD